MGNEKLRIKCLQVENKNKNPHFFLMKVGYKNLFLFLP